MDERLRSLLKRTLNVSFSLTLPFLAVLLVIGSSSLDIECWACVCFSFSLSYAVSCLNKNFVYRLAVSFIGIIIVSIPQWPLMQIVFSTVWAMIFAYSITIREWKKFALLIVPYGLVRLFIVWNILQTLPFDFQDGDALEGGVSGFLGLLGFTYSLIIIILLLDWIVDRLVKRFLVKNNVVEVHASA